MYVFAKAKRRKATWHIKDGDEGHSTLGTEMGPESFVYTAMYDQLELMTLIFIATDTRELHSQGCGVQHCTISMKLAIST